MYLRDPGSAGRWADLLRAADGIETVHDRAQRSAVGLDHDRAGDLVLVAEPGKWFTYDYSSRNPRRPNRQNDAPTEACFALRAKQAPQKKTPAPRDRGQASLFEDQPISGGGLVLIVRVRRRG